MFINVREQIDIVGEIMTTKETKQQYYVKGQQLIARYEKLKGFEWRGDPVFAVKWWIDKSEQYAPSTWGFYRLALIEFMRRRGPLEAVELLEEVGRHQCTKKPNERLTSALKQKFFPTKDQIAIYNAIDDIYNPEVRTRQRPKSNWHILKLLLEQGILLGLRIDEFKRVRLVVGNNKTILFVRNAKFDKIRSHGKYRRIHLTRYSDDQLENLQELLQIIHLNDHEKLMKNLGDCLYRLCKQLFPRRKKTPSLYSMRHQFIANAKAAELSDVEIAALVGHKVNDTAKRHYARAGKGCSLQCLVSADKRDMKRVVKVSADNYLATLCDTNTQSPG